MSTLTEIKAPVADHLDHFAVHFKKYLKSNVPLLDKILAYVIRTKGKQMRPLFVMLSADMCGQINESTYRAASLIELLHTATLLHDDIVDEAHMRRGFLSVNALWKNKFAVLTGDFLLSRGMLLALESKEYELLQIVSTAVKDMSEGELLQLEKARRMDISMELYEEIIRKKTASLFASCCATGAASVGASLQQIDIMKQFGETIGIAFQIKDDLFDYDLMNQSGKPAAIDIRDQKMTLPLILFLNHLNWIDRKRYILKIKQCGKDPVRVKEIIDAVKNAGAMQLAEDKMKQLITSAEDILNTFPLSDSREALKKLIKFTIERNK